MRRPSGRDLPGIYPADVNLDPALPDRRHALPGDVPPPTGTTVDGVLAVDPVVLSYLLGRSGPVQVPGGAPLAGEHGGADPAQ